MMNQDSFLTSKVLLLLQFGGWTAYALTDHIGHLMFDSNHLSASLISGVAAWLLTGMLALANNRAGQCKLVVRSIFFASCLFVGAVVWNKMFMIAHGDNTLAEVLQFSVQQWLSGVSFACYLFIAWAGLYLGSKYFLAHRDQQLALNQALLSTKQAQLQTLRYQLNPHFLFNVLNSIDVSVQAKDTDTSHRMLQHLSHFLRNSLTHGEQEMISLKQEMQVMADFIAIEQIRFGDAIAIRLNVESDCEAAFLPPMLLQPLIENAIKFAWSQSHKGEVLLVARRQQRQLVIEISNSKDDLPTKAGNTGTGTGLRNTVQRLQVTYGDDASLTTADLDGRYKVELRLPWVCRLQQLQ